MQENTEENQPTEKEENVGMAVISYFLFFVPLLTEYKDDPFVKFHVKQSLMITGMQIVLYILRSLPILGRLLWELSSYIHLGILVLFVLGVINALNKQKKEVPLIGQFAEKIFKF